MYTVLGATGNTGKAVAEYLLENGQQVRVVGRSAEKLQPLVDKGAQAVISEIADVDKLTEAFAGADAIYILSPPVYGSQTPHKTYNENARSIRAAVEKSGVKYVVNLSSIGADHAEGLGPVSWLYENEQIYNEMEGINLLHLRPGYFMENFLMSIQPIMENGILPNMMDANFAHGFIATADIGKIAAKKMMSRDFEGNSFFEIHGNQKLNMLEVTKILGDSVERENLQYVQISAEDFKGALTGMGMHDEIASAMVELNVGFNKGLAKNHQDKNESNTGEISLEWFAQNVFAKIAKS